MVKLKKEKGLIRYSSENEILGKKRKVITFRSALYVIISLSFISLFGFFLNQISHLSMVFIRAKVPFMMVDSGSLVLNHFTVKLGHQGEKIYEVELKIAEPELQSLVQLVTAAQPVVVDKPEKKIVLFFKFPQSILVLGSRKITVNAVDSKTGQVISSKEVTLVGPAR
jgi:hypothetical protein